MQRVFKRVDCKRRLACNGKTYATVAMGVERLQAARAIAATHAKELESKKTLCSRRKSSVTHARVTECWSNHLVNYATVLDCLSVRS